ncbi:hypothetical protein P691DRAFT_716672 [Macrolepiota fuliginosa MF-IS2]|uniref:Zn(2)-C6 fungal-type domain-containing protein n=1 Tax=Macrolepiota fuliginosa MF-IS2 TaxID=1400762 RepID=A0A9P5XSV7_9AGAR|nr:hypothetical protein P691DRAFT_716672 [Macrolepiota fuliginosa MF-IS2]
MFAISMSGPRSHSRSETFHASQSDFPGNISHQNPILPPHSHEYAPDANRVVSESLSVPYTRSRSHLYQNVDISFCCTSEQPPDRQDVLGPETLPSSDTTCPQVSDKATRPVLSGVLQMERSALAVGIDTFPTAVRSSTSEEPAPAASPSSAVSSDTGHWAPTTVLSVQEHTPDFLRPKKRREKPHIELAPDQPPTTQGRPRARVYVACVQCRTRKIRCDGAKPVCHNCGRRTAGNSECSYDSVPKRRGPDKNPGGRQRMARDVRNQLDNPLLHGRRRRRAPDTPSPDAHSGNKHSFSSLSPPPMLQEGTIVLPVPLVIPSTINTASSGQDDLCPPAATDIHSHYICGCHGVSPCPGLVDRIGYAGDHKAHHLYHDVFSPPILTTYAPNYVASQSYITGLDENGNEQTDDHSGIASQPSLEFTRVVWWDSLLTFYMSSNDKRIRILSPSQRDSAAQNIASDLRFVFKASNYWFSFFHIPTFFSNFFDPTRRKEMQPSLVLALLAMSTFWQSSEIGSGSVGRERALRFRDEAQGALEASLSVGWLDETLAQAAWLLALFEVCAHPRHSSERCVSALVLLDSIIRSLSLTFLDADDPTTTLFPPRTVPVVPIKDQQKTSWSGYQSLTHPRQVTPSTVMYYTSTPSPVTHHQVPKIGCSCASLTLGAHWPSTNEHAPLWGPTPAWNDSWSQGEIRKESIRRLCWSAMVAAAGHISYTTAHRSHNLDLFVANPANYALLFSGESIAKSPALSTSSKDTIWALQDRCFLLWHGCIRMRTDQSATDAENAQFATRAWLEADALEAALNRHTCSIERAFLFQAREYIFNTRMSISYEFQRYIPLVNANTSGLFHRHKAEEWLRHQATVAERFMHGLHTITGNANNLLARRPFFVFWFMAQVTRSLSLWECDNTLTVALDVCKALLPAIDYLSALWPCPEQRLRYGALRKRLDRACNVARVGPPPPLNLTLPSPASPETLV